MKKFLGLLGVAILGGAITLGGYTLLLPETGSTNPNTTQSLQTINTNYTPAFNTADVDGAEAVSIDFRLAAEKTVNSVVHVKNTSIRTQTNPFADLFFGGGGSRQYEAVGTGSGVIISSDGYIVTNNHVIAGARDLEITLNNNKKYKAELIGADKTNDIALLKIDADEQLPYTPFADSDNIRLGEWVLAVGNPYNLTSTVTAGIVSAKGRDLEGNSSIESFIQTDAAVNPGNSGGALVNVRGELVGINTAISSRTGSFIGYSFAVPSNIAKKIVDDILEFGAVQEAVIGIQIDRNFDDSGVKIDKVFYDGGARKAGLKDGDVIKRVNDVNISKFSDLVGQLNSKRPGEYVDITVDRDGEFITKSVELSKKPKRFISNSFRWELENLSKQELRQNNIKSGAKIINSADRRDLASLNGFIITKVNDEEVENAEDGVKLLENAAKSGNYVVIEMINTDGEKERFRFR